MEVWKRYPTGKGEVEYYVSNKGQVKSVKNGVEHILKPQKQSAGYLCVFLSVNGYKECKLIHRLVGEMFLDNPDNKPQINHKDQDKTNNDVENLEFVTARENMNYGDIKERIANKKRVAIIAINTKGEVADFDSLQELCETFSYFNRQRVAEVLENNTHIFKPGVEIPFWDIEKCFEYYNPEMAITDRNGEPWRLYKVDKIWDKKDRLIYESPESRKRKKEPKPYAWLDEEPVRYVKPGEMVTATLPRDKWGNVVGAEPLPDCSHIPAFLEEVERKRKDK